MNDIISGIYKIDFPNGKVYIGLTCNLKRRIKEHNTSAFSEKAQDHNLPVHLAIQKYGKVSMDKEVHLLEAIDPEDRELLNEKERFWIQQYHSTDKTCGYNLTPGGDGASSGINNNSAKLDQEKLEEIYDLLINHPELYIYQIAERYNLSPEAISKINNGVSYFSTSLKYPLREKTVFKQGHHVENGTKNHLSKFTEKDIDMIYDLLLYAPEKTIREIGDLMHVSQATISNINLGKRYVRDGYTYPLRTTKVKRPRYKFSQEEVLEIKNALRDPSMSIKKIAAQWDCSIDTIKRLNSGQTYYDPNQTYPIRVDD